MKHIYRVLVLVCVTTFNLIAQHDPVTPHVSPTLHFTENLGQWNSIILFKAQLDGGSLFFENNGLTFNFYDKKKLKKLHMGGALQDGDYDIKSHAFNIEFLNCNKYALKEVNEPGSDYENFFIGSNKSQWKSDVKNYHRLWYRKIYNGIDYEVISTNTGIKYSFYSKAGSDPSQIQLKYSGTDKLFLENGALKIMLSVNEIIEQKPYAYQNINGTITEVVCNYKLNKNVLSFDFPNNYNVNYDLVIDPVLVFAAQSGSTADNFGMTATFDAAGNLYSGGTVFDNGYPTTLGAYSNTFMGTPSAGNTDVVVTKYNSTGTNLLFSTYLGGTGSEIVTSLIVDAANNLFLYGATGSNNFPITFGAFDNTFNGGNYLNFVFNGTEFINGTDIYVAKLNSTGSSLLGSTYLGGSGNDGVNHTNALITYIATTCLGPFSLTEYKPDSLQYNYGDQYRGEITLDKNGDVYIASSTRSANFPFIGGFDNTLGGKQDAIIAKFNSGLTNLIWSSYLGGGLNDAGYALVVDDSLQVYVTGGTFSTDFPTKAGCYQTGYNGGKADGYIAKINSSGNTILKATYIGTNNYDQSYFIQLDNKNNVYVFGQSLGNMPVIGAGFSNPNSHQFISRLNGQLSNLNLSTVFGSGNPKIDISPSAFAVDTCGNMYLSGWGGNFIFCSPLGGMPVTPGAMQTIPPNGFDFYIMALTANATSLTYASYFGGNLSQEHVDGGTSRFDKKGIVYQSVCAGCGGNDDFPVTLGAWPNTPGDPNHSFNCNNGVFKFDFQPTVSKASISSNTINSCAPLTVTFTNGSTGYVNYQWSFGPGDTTSTILNPIKTFTVPGTYTVSLVINKNSVCYGKDSTAILIVVTSCVGVNEIIELENKFMIYPNPSEGKLNISSDNYIDKINITDALGKIIFTDNLIEKKSFQVNVSDFRNGLYFLNVVSDNYNYHLKFIKE